MQETRLSDLRNQRKELPSDGRTMALKAPPSTKWSSFNGWEYNGMKERLKEAIKSLDRSALTHHAGMITTKRFTMSKPFSAGQYWICFEMLAEDGSLIIARVRLPRHPNTLVAVTEEDEQYAIECEIATMEFVRRNAPAIRVPKVYAYENPGSEFATRAGASYMLLEGFYGNTLQDIQFDMYTLPAATQENIITQWTMIQTELASLAYHKIGSISSISETGEPIIGKLSTSSSHGLIRHGPFSSAAEYFTSIAIAGVMQASLSTKDAITFAQLGAFIFMDIVEKTELFNTNETCFPLNHMDLGTQNILVDDSYHFLAVIDWEFAQTAPWEVNHFPMPFPLVWSDEKIDAALKDPGNRAHRAISQQAATRQMYIEKFQDAERKLQEKGQRLRKSFPCVLTSAASRIYACYDRIGSAGDGDEDLVREMVRLAFGFDKERTSDYLKGIEGKIRQSDELQKKL